MKSWNAKTSKFIQQAFGPPYKILFLIAEQINKQVCVSVAGSVDKISMIALSIDQAYNCLIHFYTVQSVYTGQGPGTVHVYAQLWAQRNQE